MESCCWLSYYYYQQSKASYSQKPNCCPLVFLAVVGPNIQISTEPPSERPLSYVRTYVFVCSLILLLRYVPFFPSITSSACCAAKCQHCLRIKRGIWHFTELGGWHDLQWFKRTQDIILFREIDKRKLRYVKVLAKLGWIIKYQSRTQKLFHSFQYFCRNLPTQSSNRI